MSGGRIGRRLWRPQSIRFWLVVSLLLMGGMLYLVYLYPGQGIGPPQPIPFSHRLHAGVKQINCRFCHPFVDRSARAGLPDMKKCFYCHDYIIPLHPQLVEERAHLNREQPIPWRRIYFVPDYVKFRHQPHIELAKLDCVVCHGPVSTMDRLRPVKFEMGFCIACHQKMEAQTDCWLACHH